MLTVTDGMIAAVLTEIHSYLAGWTTPDTFEDYVEDDTATVFLEIIADGSWGCKIMEPVADWMEITPTPEDLEYDNGAEAVEEAAEKLADILNKKIQEAEPDLVGSVCFGTNDYTGDYGLLYQVEVDDLPYPKE